MKTVVFIILLTPVLLHPQIKKHDNARAILDTAALKTILYIMIDRESIRQQSALKDTQITTLNHFNILKDKRYQLQSLKNQLSSQRPKWYNTFIFGFTTSFIIKNFIIIINK